MTGNLGDFLLARIAEDEKGARAAGSGPWHWDQGYGDMCNDAECPFGSLMQVKEDGHLYELMDVHGYDVNQEWEGAEHIARWDPARVLAECDAKRRIVELHRLVPVDLAGDCCMTCLSGEDGNQYIPGLCDTLHLLAAPYADHPDYREEWKS